MNYNFDYSYSYGPSAEMGGAFFMGFAFVFCVIILFSAAFGIAMYVLRSIAVYGIAKRRGLNSPWLAWIPVGRDWILGSISDQYKYLTKGKDQSRRIILLVFSLVSLLVGAVSSGVGIVGVVRVFMAGPMASDGQVASAIMGPAMGGLLVGLISGLVSVTAYVFRCLCKYDLYRSCDPKNAVVFLVLGIFFNITEPFFLLSCRNKDLGMPPRKPEMTYQPAPEPVTEEPEEFEE